MKKQTAVEWLKEAIDKKLSSGIGPYFLDLFENALEMEKDQIVSAIDDFSVNQWGEFLNGEEYYNENYNKNNGKN